MAENLLVNFHFKVDWGGTRIGFTEVTGLDIEQEVLEYREGASPEYAPIKIPGLRRYSNIILKRGVFKSDNEYYEWLNTTQLNIVEKRDITISLLNESHEPVVVWLVKSAWPVALKSTNLHSTNSEIAIESLELAHEGLSIEHT
ncbi:phage tail protein [Zobellia alginiliquefaciens]|uniref:phage tail protein n=1 Tax=Zobellia alginiliquefaciens TaxID=3032586 RepID=UPI0023E3770E|nr:phage tail protein [Zobellia alginiliquefaciens]